MEHQEMLNILNERSHYRFVTRKWTIVNDQLSTGFDVGNENVYNAELSKCNLCDQNEAYRKG